ncbi:MAG: TOMM precursor leader peptide-binding protein [Actinobacteria bacterium]|nr:TOMM precursor leader peptide-binding protein [Actinomycetota bacterium]
MAAASATGTRVQLVQPTLALWRAPGVLQVGLDSPALVLERVPSALAEAIALLARPHSCDELRTLVPSLDDPWLSWLIDRLGAAGLLAPAPTTAEPVVRVVGGGPLAQAVTAALNGGGLRATRSDPVRFAALPTAPDATEVVLLAGSSVEPDRATTDSLFRDGRAHLVVRLEPDHAVVGPFVQPGRTPCVRCLDLTRVRLDGAWPSLLAQLCREPAVPEPSLVAWAAATAAVQVRAWLSGRVPETAGATLELDLVDFRLRSRAWPAHPGCGCLVPPG